MENPISFIATGEDGTGLIINPEAVAIIREVKKPLMVISVVGPYRTGKSFLLNLLMGRTDGFPLGNAIEAKTKGVWMWVGDHPDDPSKGLLLLDTEGLNDPKKGSRAHDAQLFTLAVLLSSVLVYNSKGTIDSTALDGLYFATELTEHIRVKSDTDEETGEEFSKFFPSLIWTVRDHFLDMTIDGEDVSASEYLENCLALKKGRSRANLEYNHLRETIRAFFKNRHCFLFPTPTDQDKLKDLDKLKMEDLNLGFLEVANKFKNFFNHDASCKRMDGKPVNGELFAKMAQSYVDSVASGSICIQSAFDYLIQSENTRAVDEAISSYQSSLTNLKLPVSNDKLNKANEEAQARSNALFLSSAINSDKNQDYSKQLQKALQESFLRAVEANKEESMKSCLAVLVMWYNPMEERISKGELTKPGGSREFNEFIVALEEKYETLKEEDVGPCTKSALSKFRDEKIKGSFQAILLADKALSEEERAQEQLKREMKVHEDALRALEEEKLQLQEQRKKMQDVFEKNLTEQKEEFARQQEQMQADLKSDYDERMRERERLLQEGFSEKAKQMEEELLAAQAEQKRLVEESAKRQREMQQQLTEAMNRMTLERQESEKRLQDAINNANTNPPRPILGKLGAAVVLRERPLIRAINGGKPLLSGNGIGSRIGGRRRRR